MDIPKIISRNNHEYIFVEQCNDNLFRYQDMYTKVYECFSSFDLGLVKQVVPRPRQVMVQPKKNKKWRTKK